MSPRHPRRPYRRGFSGAAAVAVGAALTLALGACSSTDDSGAGGPDAKKGDGRPELKVSGAYVPQPPTDKMAGGFLTVRNGGAKPDKLTSVSSDIAGEVEIHETVKQRMRQVKSLKVPADGALELGRGGNHLMLMDLKRKPVKGDEVTFILHFEKSGPVTVKAPVEATNYTPEK
ncbi:MULTISPECIES: copper chaperone PCu(A)C [unclassified Streptomyces]|uniref:copper chaperone PCu(A)C n=1 Tax=unclassified Streptomyces TaxID=2593676 RepID=UPI002DDB994B|nr:MULTISPECIES: copper chaperone PCu(A)C [unclassified Streptomyces]WSA93718.1 copper chaperone PCu(A)C [Streptomyces sp. NBC_01795]WSB78090.1 copper chaperone PCu(A)C [Streptomyces sp. NBC_01775]WSS13658.1 copper chaperone PCu(A)C [Streptomyces sp. NBC_01186]WSS42453.1 copper chaperone PCu(A)C [Streptomyces sp. NBC_01187]